MPAIVLFLKMACLVEMKDRPFVGGEHELVTSFAACSRCFVASVASLSFFVSLSLFVSLSFFFCLFHFVQSFLIAPFPLLLSLVQALVFSSFPLRPFPPQPFPLPVFFSSTPTRHEV